MDPSAELVALGDMMFYFGLIYKYISESSNVPEKQKKRILDFAHLNYMIHADRHAAILSAAYAPGVTETSPRNSHVQSSSEDPCASSVFPA